MRVFVEIFFLKLEGSCAVYRKEMIEITNKTEDPDGIVSSRVSGDKCIVHSTSWRFDEEARIVLTYVIYCDEMNFSDYEIIKVPISELELARGEDVMRPRPKTIDEKHVLSHAIRHLGFLLRSSGGTKYRQIVKPETAYILERCYLALAGEI